MAAGDAKRVEWSRRGLEELYESFEFIASENLPAAVAIRERIAAVAKLLETQALIGRRGQKPGTRELPIDGTPCTLVYRVTAKSVRIARVLHQRRRYP
jgi:toxin ParE1/3/4